MDKGFFPTPWELTEENDQKTQGWIAFQESDHYKELLADKMNSFSKLTIDEFLDILNEIEKK